MKWITTDGDSYYEEEMPAKVRSIKSNRLRQQMKEYEHKGVKLKPLTPAEALSLDKGDKVKYIGPPINSWNNLYDCFNRRIFPLKKKPTISGKKIIIDWYGRKMSCSIEHLALAERGNPYDYDYNHAKRLVPTNLKAFKREIGNLITKTKTKMDKYLDKLPLHKKLEFFKTLTPEEHIIYECLYKDIEVLIGLKPDQTQPDGN